MLHPSYTIFLNDLYGPETALRVEPRLLELIDRYKKQFPPQPDFGLTEKDVMLITYGDALIRAGEAPLQTLLHFGLDHLRGIVTCLHLLPFFPYSSDDGFSVMDYREVNPALGSWADVDRLAGEFKLMVDDVINHASVEGNWFQSFLRDEPPYRDYFLTVEGDPDLSQVVRPRTLPLLTDFQTAAGVRRVWTTFSADQADLDYHNPSVLLEMMDVLLGYVQHGAQFLRLDAIAYLWKEFGTPCIHLRQTHTVVQLIRAVLAEVAPKVRLITETNVPQADNLSYFGNGSNEAHLVYNFALPPLVLHAFQSGDASILTEWAGQNQTPSSETAFFNFLASHDGIGLNPVRDILSSRQIDALAGSTLAHGGRISYKQNADGSQSPYELNINYFDALSDPLGRESLALQVRRFLTAQSMLLSLRGLPGVYFHSLVGSRNWTGGVVESGRNRSINREKLQLNALETALQTPGTLRQQVFNGYLSLLQQRAASPAFHPQAAQQILSMGRSIFAVLRTSLDGTQRMLCLHNVTTGPQIAGKWSLPPLGTLWVQDPEGY
jgi:sucrose phosphorylase